MKNFYKRVYEIVSKIPRGKVATYGQIALLLGEPRSARIVGWAMKAAPDSLKLPCHRVVNRLGEMAPEYAFGSQEVQRALLISEGIIFKEDGCVDIKKCLWSGPHHIQINFTPFPKLSTERLILRQIKAEDDKEMFDIRSDENVSKYIDRPIAKTICEAKQFINKINDGIDKNKWIQWGIALKNENKLIGTICLWNISEELSKAEVGYELLPHYQGKGIMNEALIKVIEYGFKHMKLDYIEAYTSPDNKSSIKLLKRNNFTESGSIKDKSYSGDKFIEMKIYKLDSRKEV